jgi:Xaa-Pro aminopeptidase
MQCVKKLFSQYNIKVLVVKDLDNIFYLTGQRLSNGLLIILEDKKYFLSDARYIQRLKKLKDWQIIDIAQIKDIYKFLSDVVGEDRFAIEGSSWKVLEYKRLVSRFSEEKIVLLKDDFLKCRQVKTLSEIQKIKQAIYIIEQVWSYIYTNFSQFVGKSELDIRRKIIDLIFEF